MACRMTCDLEERTVCALLDFCSAPLHMASMHNGTKVLLLGAIAAASAFVVTILIVLLCVGCHRKGRTKNAQTDTENHKIIETNVLRQSKLRSMSKSDTRLHEMSRPACNGKSSSKNRPASMDLLLLPRQRSSSDLQRPQGRQLPKIPPTPSEEHEHTYSEVGHRASPIRCPDDVLYESVGGGAPNSDTPAAPPPASTQPRPQNGNGKGNGKGSGWNGSNGVPVSVTMTAPQDPVTAEYACIRKVKKMDRGQRKENEGDSVEPGDLQCYSNTELNPATPPPLPRVHEVPRKTKEAFHIHSFPKETVFMGNGEQYIWKPPEGDDITMLQHHPPGLPSIPHGESGQSHSATMEISEMYSKVCKPTKKKRPPTSPPASQDAAVNGGQTLVHCEGAEEGVGGSDAGPPQPWAGMGGGHPLEDPCYEYIGDKTFPVEESDPAYETIDANWKRDRPPNATLKPKKKKQQQQQHQHQQQHQQQPQPQPQHIPVKALPSENFYETISDVKNSVCSSSTTTIFTFNDGMEMYVTGL
ncbi:hypothetical protein AGOR_G00136800 [Albula goreensis]|uniref:Uncharacterized protein n=1 Tax=Albula goreensis TaxID=1534307 RepID=A0A8T3DE07_9TELE|nr:hypothetical protein AGOR_G00136800 [Albula goreensis]